MGHGAHPHKLAKGKRNDCLDFRGTIGACLLLASTVEFVEALTIVLAVGVVRGWRSALLGTAAALAVLVGLGGTVLGPSLTRIPLPKKAA